MFTASHFIRKEKCTGIETVCTREDVVYKLAAYFEDVVLAIRLIEEGEELTTTFYVYRTVEGGTLEDCVLDIHVRKNE